MLRGYPLCLSLNFANINKKLVDSITYIISNDKNTLKIII